MQAATEKGSDVAADAEALEIQSRRPTHGTYALTWNSKYMSIEIRKDKTNKGSQNGRRRMDVDRTHYSSSIRTTLQESQRGRRFFKQDVDGRHNHRRFELLLEE